MSCAEYRRLISGYLDETLSLRQHDALLEHLERCESCAATLARYRQMDLLLRRLPSSAPSPAVRGRVLSAPPLAQRARLPRSLSAMAATFALPLLVLALLSAGTGLWRAGGGVTTPPAVLAQRAAPGGVDRASSGVTALPVKAPGGAGDDGPVAAVDDAAVLQQVRRTVRNDRFQPLLPAYLPSGARLDTVNFGREQATGPIDRLDVAFAANGQRIQLRQLSGGGAALEQQLQAQPRWQPSKRIVVAGQEWLYLRRPDGDRGSEAVGILIGQRDGLVIWLESSLPVEELEKVAASLQE